MDQNDIVLNRMKEFEKTVINKIIETYGKFIPKEKKYENILYRF